ncbi:restriction endonuclease [Pedobacter sp. UC225_65]|uniref:restriction endonuclease n=1 Tax=Pedobacter sp. UC225_65 TaxID=3350173 RepID=UPI00366C02DB
MKEYSPEIIMNVLESSSTMIPINKGRALEGLAGYLFAQIEGFEEYGRNIVNSSRSSELDLVFSTNRHLSGLDFLDPVLFVECKNTNASSDSADVSRFAGKIKRAGLSVGVLITSSGITGTDGWSAHREVQEQLLMHGVKVLVVTGKDISGMKNTEQFKQMLKEKFMQLVVLGKVCS